MEIIKFDTLGLDPKILRAITEMGFEEPSPIQAKARFERGSSYWRSYCLDERW